jgi:hypothetical protein
MRPYAIVRVVVILTFLAWVLSAIIPFTHAPKHVRLTDTAGIAPHDVNPRPDMGVLPPTPPLTEAQATETLSQHGYINVAALQQQANGDWTATASRANSGARLSLRIGRDGRISEQ